MKAQLASLLLLVSASAELFADTAPATSTRDVDWNVLEGDGKDRRLRDHLLRVSREQYAARRKKLQDALKSRDALERYAEEKRAAYRKLVGRWPEKTPLRPQITGRLACKGYTIEKVIFETRPKHRATALLYVPDGDGPFPGVLFVCGHWANAKAYEAYQRAPALMARYGLIVLAVDPIGQGERYQQFKRRGGTTTHTLYDVGARLVGRNVVHYEAWDNIRALDYLLSRPEVDRSQRIGLTGTSGGGTQTTFLMALDDRVGPASPSCYVMTRQGKFESIGIADGCQHLPDEGLFGIDHADYAIMRLDRPTQILAAERDFFDIAKTRAAAEEIRSAYERAGHADGFELFVSDTEHGFTAPHRVAATSWMTRWLLGRTTPAKDAADLEVFPDEEIRVTKSGQVAKEFDDEIDVGELNLQHAKELGRHRDLWIAKHSPQAGIAAIRSLLRVDEPKEKAAVRRLGSFEHAGCRVEKLVIQRPKDVPIAALLFTASDAGNEKRAATLVADSRGKQATVDSAIRLARAGRIVLTVDLRGYGETRDVGSLGKFFNHEQATAYLAMHIGRTLFSQRIGDILDALDVLHADARVDRGDIHVLGVGAAGPLAMHAAAFDRRIISYETRDAIRSWIDDVVAKPLERDLIGYVVPGVLGYYDLPDLARWIEERD